MPKYQRRQRLTERVAARQGRPIEPDPNEKPPKRWPKLVAQLGFAISLVALFMLAYEALKMAESGGERDIDNMAIYAALFIGGRLVKAAVDAARPYL